MIVAGGIAPVAIAAAIALFALILDRWRSYEAKSLEVTRLSASAIDVELQRNIAALRTLALSTELDRDDLSAFTTSVQRVLQEMPAWSAISLATPEERVLVHTAAPGHIEPQAVITEPESFRRAVRERRPVVGRMTRRENLGWSVAIRVPVIGNGQLRYVLTAIVLPETFRRVVETQNLPPDWTLSVFDAAGARVARSRDHVKYLGTPGAPSLIELMSAAEPYGIGPTRTLEGDAGATAYVRLPGSGWSVAISIPTRDLLASSIAAVALYVSGVAVSILLAIFGSVAMVRGILRSIRRLQAAAGLMGQGAVPPKVDSSYTEISELADAMSEAASARARAESDRAQAFRDLDASREELELLNETGRQLASRLGLSELLQTVTDAATELSGAKFGAFFYNTIDEQGAAYQLFVLSGAPREAFEKFGHPRATALFAPTFEGKGVIRSDDITQDPRYGRWGPHHGMPKGHLPVRSYLAVPVISRSGEVIGGLFFGHPEANVFTERTERLLAGISAQAAVAIDNARLYERAQRLAVERERLLDSERAARSEVERESASKDEFVATLSHELRTPLNAILGWAQILRAGKLQQADMAKALETIERNARLQAQLVSDLLDMSRIIAGKLPVESQVVIPVTFVDAAIDALMPTAIAKNIRIERNIDPLAGPVNGDPARLQQIVWNLLSNAIKFTPRGGKVEVSLRRAASNIEIAVSDNGIGIEPRFLPRVFQRFRQADATMTREQGGLGLGLAIAKHLVDLHGGTIEAFSGGAQQGSRFTVRLPVRAVYAAGGTPAAPSIPAADQALTLRDVRVLVVDDEPDSRDMVGRVLEEGGAMVTTASSGEDALRHLQAQLPDVVVTDLSMPRMDGYELVRRLRALGDAAARVPVIALTALARSEDRQRVLAAGFVTHLAKPVETSELRAAVADAVRQRDPRVRPESTAPG